MIGTAKSNPKVASYTGAWIEIEMKKITAEFEDVAPYTGAWIEIRKGETMWLKRRVAPYTGAWIEIYFIIFYLG